MTSNIDPADSEKAPSARRVASTACRASRDGEADVPGIGGASARPRSRRRSRRGSARSIRSTASWTSDAGAARITMWLEGLAGTERALRNRPSMADALEWASANFPYASFERNGQYPPFAVFPTPTSDLVFSSSVFTHIDEHAQDLWLAELRRVTRPGGYLLLSVHGERAFPARRGCGARGQGQGHDGLGAGARDARDPVRRGRQLGRRAVFPTGTTRHFTRRGTCSRTGGGTS